MFRLYWYLFQKLFRLISHRFVAMRFQLTFPAHSLFFLQYLCRFSAMWSTIRGEHMVFACLFECVEIFREKYLLILCNGKVKGIRTRDASTLRYYFVEILKFISIFPLFFIWYQIEVPTRCDSAGLEHMDAHQHTLKRAHRSHTGVCACVDERNAIIKWLLLLMFFIWLHC